MCPRGSVVQGRARTCPAATVGPSVEPVLSTLTAPGGAILQRSAAQQEGTSETVMKRATHRARPEGAYLHRRHRRRLRVARLHDASSARHAALQQEGTSDTVMRRATQHTHTVRRPDGWVLQGVARTWPPPPPPPCSPPQRPSARRGQRPATPPWTHNSTSRQVRKVNITPCTRTGQEGPGVAENNTYLPRRRRRALRKSPP